MSLTIAPDLTLPVEAVTETFAILGKRGVGKTHTASVMAEEMLATGAQVVVLDPLDVWWGLRATPNGDASKYQIIVMGGSHADIPLEANAGRLIADFVVEQRASAILSLRHFSKADQRRFVTDFCEHLYHRKGEPAYREALHLFIDEADAFAPQRVLGDMARCMGAIDDLVRRGRSSGLGVTLVTQRSAAINKDVLTQVEMIVAHRTISPQDRKALDAWVEAHDAHDQRGEFNATLASLEKGAAWFWSPGWLDIFQLVKVRTRKTYDSSKTPEPGAAPMKAVALRPVDIEQLRERLAATIEKAKANDPNVLRRRIAELEKDARKRQANGHAPDPGALQEAREELRQVRGDLKAREQRFAVLAKAVATAAQALDAISERLLMAVGPPEPTTPAPQRDRIAVDPRPSPAAAERRQGSVPTDGLGSAQMRVLNAIAAFNGLGIVQPERAAVAAVAGYKQGGHFNNTVSSMRSAGLLDYPSASCLALTEDGAAVATPVELGTLADLHDYWLRLCSGPQARILRALIDAYPEAVTRADLASRVEMQEGGHFNNTVSSLKTLNAATYPSKGEVRAADILFPEALA